MNVQYLTEILRGLEVGRVQSAGLMQMIPLWGKQEFVEATSPEETEVTSPTYGIMRFSNPDGKAVIVPQGAAYITRMKAQDHGSPIVIVVPPKTTVVTDKAMCVESSQPGHFDRLKQGLKLLPFNLRGQAFGVRREISYSKLWDYIGKFNRNVGAGGRSHIVDYYDKFDQELEHFTAEFEPIHNQLGAIFLLGGKVVGIERVPNYAYWRNYWRTLVKDCYGGLALYIAAQKIDMGKPTTRRALTGRFGDLDAIYQALLHVETQEEEATRAVVRELLAEPLQVTKSDQHGAFVVQDVESPFFIGQTVENGGVIYASLFTPEAELAAERAKAFVI